MVDKEKLTILLRKRLNPYGLSATPAYEYDLIDTWYIPSTILFTRTRFNPNNSTEYVYNLVMDHPKIKSVIVKKDLNEVLSNELLAIKKEVRS